MKRRAVQDSGEPRELFSGPAREAALRFPENVNVAAALSLAGVGLDRTSVRVVADPAVSRNTHEISAKGYFGEIRIVLQNIPGPNPKTGRIVPLAMIKALRNLTAPVWWASKRWPAGRQWSREPDIIGPMSRLSPTPRRTSGGAGGRPAAPPRVTARRVAITGIGALTPCGIGREGLWQGVLAERSPVRRITRFDPSPFRSQIAAEVDGFDPLDWMDAKKARRLDRYSQFSLACARMALADAELTVEPAWSDQAAVYVGSALGGLAFAEEQHATFLGRGLRGGRAEPGALGLRRGQLLQRGDGARHHRPERVEHE